MKDNEIYDYIKKETEKIPVPESLAPKQIEQKLSGKRQKKFIYHRRLTTTFAAAACLLLVVIAGFSAYPRLSDSGTPPFDVAKKDDASQAVTYKEVCSRINSYVDTATKWSAALTNDGDLETVQEESTGGSDGMVQKSAPSDDSAASPSSDYSDTDVQVKGIMEGDIVKTDGSHIYAVKETNMGYQISVYRADGGDTEEISRISVANSDCSEMYLQNGRLILIGNSWLDSTEEESDVEWRRFQYGYRRTTVITVYDISKPEAPKKLSSLTQSGQFNTSRFSDGCLYTFTSHMIEHKKYDEAKPEEYVPQIDGKAIAEKDIQLLDDTGSNQYLVMTSLKLDSPKQFAGSSTTLGGGDIFYVSDSGIYVTKTSVQNSWLLGGSQDFTTIAKYNYKDGKFTYHASTHMRGMIKNSYYMHEYKGNFCFVYTRGTNRSTTNGLCILDKDLEPLGEISDLGENERIYSSYYMDNMAYFVTFRETDPVFAVDISNPKKPVLKSELKLPGFSSYLHSFGDGKLLGIGEDFSERQTQGVKFSMFSIDKNYQITESAKKILSPETACIADYNHKAVFVDEERSLFGLGISDYAVDENGEQYAEQYAVYRYNKNKFEKVLSVKLSSEIEDVRGLRINNTFYVVDVNHGVEAYDMNTWKKL